MCVFYYNFSFMCAAYLPYGLWPLVHKFTVAVVCKNHKLHLTYAIVCCWSNQFIHIYIYIYSRCTLKWRGNKKPTKYPKTNGNRLSSGSFLPTYFLSLEFIVFSTQRAHTENPIWFLMPSLSLSIFRYSESNKIILYAATAQVPCQFLLTYTQTNKHTLIQPHLNAYNHTNNSRHIRVGILLISIC